jgi:peptidoglycan lytic transglycosylase F
LEADIAHRPSSPLARRLALIVAIVALAAAFAWFIIARRPEPLAPPREARELIVMIHPGPVVYFPGPDGEMTGFDLELVRQFAKENALTLRLVLADSTAQLINAVARGEAHIGAGALYRPLATAPAKTSDAIATTEADPETAARDVLWTIGFATVEPMLIYNRDGYKPAAWRDLDGATIAYLESSGFAEEIDAMRRAHSGIRWQPFDLPSAAALISQVSDGTVSYAIINSVAAALARNIYVDFDVAFTAGPKRELAWAVPPHFADLQAELDRFLARLERDGTLARMFDRFVPQIAPIPRVDAGVMHERLRTVLPVYRPYFHAAQEKTGIEWRLLAAIAYQESQWDPSAQSETGVRGLMQMTEDTAKQVGVRNLLDPAQSVLGAARYLRDLKDRLPARIREPERTWLALAAFNIGLGHVEDARVLAQKQKLDPDLWSDVKKALPLLALPEYYTQAKLGYARGGMPVAFVDRVRSYYDVLLAQEPPHQPRLRLLASPRDDARGVDGTPSAK